MVTGCTGPFTDLRKPVCLVFPPSEHQQRLQFIAGQGLYQWTRHIPNLPKPIITNKARYCTDNPPVIIRTSTTLRGAGLTRSYSWGWTIDIDPDYGMIPAVLAHELGHVLITMSHEKKRLSIMNRDGGPLFILPDDISALCRAHPEITCPQLIWCEGKFHYPIRCPSRNPEEGEELLRRELNVR